MSEPSRLEPCPCGCEMVFFYGADRGVMGRDAVDVERLATLAHNLAIGAGLCESFRLGGKHADDLWDADVRRLWRPGCQRPAP